MTNTKTEAYWTARNALVDAVLAVTPPSSICFKSYDNRTADDHAVMTTYGAALDALRAFDAAHGGTPIL